ncbi:MAG: hypothetical protein Greene041619_148 [Candidatus Peregrinibacteria bacterium Greene0416_19]|nr:MAG: hypothetical protein Greene041619_148 [Candidatus Peregrinibacteria bacterium Greene0416_19]
MPLPSPRSDCPDSELSPGQLHRTLEQLRSHLEDPYWKWELEERAAIARRIYKLIAAACHNCRAQWAVLGEMPSNGEAKALLAEIERCAARVESSADVLAHLQSTGLTSSSADVVTAIRRRVNRIRQLTEAF